MVVTLNRLIGSGVAVFAAATISLAQTLAPAADLHKAFGLLENKYFGRTFEHDTDAQRTERLESFIYGEPLKEDMLKRTSALVTAAAKLNPPIAPSPVSRTSRQVTHTADGVPPDEVQDVFQENAPRDYSRYDAAAKPKETKTQDYPRVTALEKAILKRTFVGRPLDERLARMEKKAFGLPSQDEDLGRRTDNLETYARQKLHIDIVQQYDENGKPKQTPDMQQVAGMLGRTLLGLAGFPGAGMGSSTGGPGFGPRMGPGFNNSALKARQQQEQTKDEAARREEEILLKSPPPGPQSKLLLKVSWCEMRVFGQTYRDMHLPDRLTQLNEQLHFAAGSGADLMDHISDMMRRAQACKPVGQPLARSSDSEDE